MVIRGSFNMLRRFKDNLRPIFILTLFVSIIYSIQYMLFNSCAFAMDVKKILKEQKSIFEDENLQRVKRRNWKLEKRLAEKPQDINAKKAYNKSSKELRILKARQIVVKATTNPSTISQGSPTQINVLVLSSKGEPIPKATVMLYAGGGLFQANKNQTIVGQTDAKGSFKISWQCSPCAPEYEFGIEVTHSGYLKGKGLAKVSIK